MKSPKGRPGFCCPVVSLLAQYCLAWQKKKKKKMASSISTVFHITVFSWYAFIVKTLADKDGEELPAGIFVYGGPWKYLTFLNLVRFCFAHMQIHTVNARLRTGRTQSVRDACAAASVAPDDLFRPGRRERPAV